MLGLSHIHALTMDDFRAVALAAVKAELNKFETESAAHHSRTKDHWKEMIKITRIYGEWLPPLAYCVLRWHLRHSKESCLKWLCARAAADDLKRVLDESS